jgi:hypothetical protein
MMTVYFFSKIREVGFHMPTKKEPLFKAPFGWIGWLEGKFRGNADKDTLQTERQR